MLFSESPHSRQGNVIIALLLIRSIYIICNFMLRQRNARCTGNVPNSIQSGSLLCCLMIYRPIYLGDGYWVPSQDQIKSYQLFHSFVEWGQS